MKRIFVNSLICLVLTLTALSLLDRANAKNLTVPTRGQQQVVLQQVVSGLTNPVYVTNAHDGTNRLFIIEQRGIVKVLQPGATTPTVFLNITSRVLSGGERGLIGLAFHPQYATNRRFFVHYTCTTTNNPSCPSTGAHVIAEYETSAPNPNEANTTQRVILTVAQPFSNHNGGMIEFGPLDGFLYIGLGDGGSANDPGNRAQNRNVLLGKILRINIDSPSESLPYSIPADNPYVGGNGLDEIWVNGLRNPWRFSFDRGGTRLLYCGDVGQGAFEEINIIRRGNNYGWRVFEGTRCTNLDPNRCTPIYTFPISQYDHSGGRCSVTGGYVYRGIDRTFAQGTYLFADFCSGEIFRFRNNVTSVLMDTTLNISSFGEDERGEIYVVNLNGAIFKLVPAVL